MLEDEGRGGPADPGVAREPIDPAVPVAPVGSCPYLHLAADGAACLALPPALRISARQVELLCAGPTHVDCPRHARGGSVERPVSPPRLVPRRSDAPILPATDRSGRGRTDGMLFGMAPPAPAPPAQTGASASDTSVDPATLARPDPTFAREGAPNAAAVWPTGVNRYDGPTGSAPVPGPFATLDGHAAADPVPASLDVAAGPEARPSLFGSSEPSLPTTRKGASAGRARRAIFSTSQAHERSVVLRPATAAASLTLVAAIVIAIGFVAARGGLTLPSTSPTSSGLGAGGSGAVATGLPGASPAAPSGSLAAQPASPSPTASGSPAQASGGPASPSPSISPDKLALLTPCPKKPDCYRYRIAQGDTLAGIARFFNVPYATLRKLNPQITNPSIIHIGEFITLPTPGG